MLAPTDVLVSWQCAGGLPRAQPAAAAVAAVRARRLWQVAPGASGHPALGAHLCVTLRYGVLTFCCDTGCRRGGRSRLVVCWRQPARRFRLLDQPRQGELRCVDLTACAGLSVNDVRCRRTRIARCRKRPATRPDGANCMSIAQILQRRFCWNSHSIGFCITLSDTCSSVSKQASTRKVANATDEGCSHF